MGTPSPGSTKLSRSSATQRRHAGAAAHEGALRQAASPTSRLPVYQLLLVWSVAAAGYCPSQEPRSCRAPVRGSAVMPQVPAYAQGRFAPRLAHATSPLFVIPTRSVWSVRAARLRHAQSVGGLVSAAGGRRVMVRHSRFGHPLRGPSGLHKAAFAKPSAVATLKLRLVPPAAARPRGFANRPYAKWPTLGSGRVSRQRSPVAARPRAIGCAPWCWVCVGLSGQALRAVF